MFPHIRNKNALCEGCQGTSV